MTKYFIEEQTLQDIVDVVKNKINIQEEICIENIPTEIENFEVQDMTKEIVNKTITNYWNENISKVRGNAFMGCGGLSSIYLPNCTNIGDEAFYMCNGLNSVNFPACTDIGGLAFYGCTKLSYADFPSCTTIGNDAFERCYYLSSVSFPVCTDIHRGAFAECSKLTSVYFPTCSTISYGAFKSCKNLTSVNFPVCISIDSHVFSQCTNLTYINFPACTSIKDHGFYGCSNFVSVNFPMCSAITYNTFYGCVNLKSINFPVCTTVGQCAFGSCTGIEYVDFPACTSISYSAFYGCTSLKSISFPACITIGQYAFKSCTGIEYVDFPACASIYNYAFDGCKNLASASFQTCANISSYAFQNCTNLVNLTLLSTSICKLSNSNAFTSTPIANGAGYIYVYPRLLSSYKTATNWAYYSSKILPYGFAFEAIGNFILLFNESKQISIPVYNANENAIYNITSSDENVVTISNIVQTTDSISFDVLAGTTKGRSVIRVEGSCDGHVWIEESTVSVYEENPIYYTVKSVDGASYGFELNDNGYYESTNKGKQSSAAVCKIEFGTDGASHLYLDCINSGESNYDFGLISNVDETLTTSYATDIFGVFKSFIGQSSTSVTTIDMGVVEEGDHFIYIKFRKDGSGNNGNDSLQFKVRIE